MARLRILTLVSLLLAVVVFLVKNHVPATVTAGDGLLLSKSWLSINQHPQVPVKDVRPPDQTFLTFPEWFLVFSPAEQAAYFKTHTSTTFPYLKHTDQLWKGYDVVYDQIKGNYPFNTGYHVMIMVIAGSTTIEYGIKAWYETVFGRVTDTDELTSEDQFNAQYMQSYVDFIEDTPWYEYNFSNQLKTLWADDSIFGTHFLRKLERRYYLTTELLVKGAYGWLIKQATQASYDAALLNTTVVIDSVPKNKMLLKEVRNVRNLPGSLTMMDLPRYADFNTSVCKLARNGVKFTEIAGNKGAIMLTVLAGKPLQNSNNCKVLFTQPIVTQPGISRVALVTTVGNLSPVVVKLLNSNIAIEHIYDY